MNVILEVALVWLILVGCVLSLLRAAALGDRAAEPRRGERRPVAETRRRAGRVALVVAALPLAGVNAPDASARGCAGARTTPDRSGPDASPRGSAAVRTAGSCSTRPSARSASASSPARPTARGRASPTPPSSGAGAAESARS